MLVLAAFPIVAWIPCYLAAKAIARRTSSKLGSQGSIVPVLGYGAAATLFAIYVFGGLIVDIKRPIQYTTYREPETGVQFEHPTFLAPTSEVNKQRTDLGTVFTVVQITAESTNPAGFMYVRIIEDPTRNEMFPELYPPDDQSLRLLAMGDIADFQFKEEELPESELIEAARDARIIEVDGFPAAEWEISPFMGPLWRRMTGTSVSC